MTGLLLALALLGQSEADEPEVWSALYAGRLLASADADHGAAVAAYEAVLEHLPADDPQRGALSYWLGRALLDSGEPQRAWKMLVEAAQSDDPQLREGARKLLAGLQLAEVRVQSLPLSARFAEGRSPLVRGWTRGALEDLKVVREVRGAAAALAWSVDVVAGQDDFLRAALGPGAQELSRVRLQLGSTRFPSQVRVVLEDDEGVRWTAPILAVPEEGWLPVALGLSAFAPADAPAAERRPRPGSIRALELRDVTAFLSEERGENVLLVSELELR